MLSVLDNLFIRLNESASEYVVMNTISYLTPFLAIQNSSIGDLDTHRLTHFTTWQKKSDPRDLWPLRHLIIVMQKHLWQFWRKKLQLLTIWEKKYIFWQPQQIVKNVKIVKNCQHCQKKSKCQNCQKMYFFQNCQK